MFFTLTDQASTTPSDILRGLLDRRRHVEHPQSSNESIKTKTKPKIETTKRTEQ